MQSPWGPTRLGAFLLLLLVSGFSVKAQGPAPANGQTQADRVNKFHRFGGPGYSRAVPPVVAIPRPITLLPAPQAPPPRAAAPVPAPEPPGANSAPSPLLPQALPDYPQPPAEAAPVPGSASSPTDAQAPAEAPLQGTAPSPLVSQPPADAPQQRSALSPLPEPPAPAPSGASPEPAAASLSPSPSSSPSLSSSPSPPPQAQPPLNLPVSVAERVPLSQLGAVSSAAPGPSPAAIAAVPSPSPPAGQAIPVAALIGVAVGAAVALLAAVLLAVCLCISERKRRDLMKFLPIPERPPATGPKSYPPMPGAPRHPAALEVEDPALRKQDPLPGSASQLSTVPSKEKPGTPADSARSYQHRGPGAWPMP